MLGNYAIVFRTSSVSEQNRKLSEESESNRDKGYHIVAEKFKQNLPYQKFQNGNNMAPNVELRWRLSCKIKFHDSLFARTRSRARFRHFPELDHEPCRRQSAQLIRTTFIGNNVMSASERTPAAETSHNIEYTVRQTAKIHREKQQDYSRSSVWLSVAKWIVGIFLFISVLTCLIASKISLLSMASIRNKNATDTEKEDPKQNQETLFIMAVLVLMIPEGFSFLTACWTSLFSKNRKWPCKKAIIVVSIFFFFIELVTAKFS